MTTNKYEGPERRTYMRIGADCAIDYQKLSTDLKPLQDIVNNCYSTNISGAGVKFKSRDKIPIGTFLELYIKIQPAKKVISSICKVLRCEKEGSEGYGIAVSFIWINKNDREQIDEYVKSKQLEKLRSEIKE